MPITENFKDEVDGLDRRQWNVRSIELCGCGRRQIIHQSMNGHVEEVSGALTFL